MNKEWFIESDEFYLGEKAEFPREGMCIQIEKILFHEKSEFQDILFFKSKSYGMVFVLDGAIQVTERDQFAYAEMISHIPLFAHSNPKKALVIGGGDGAVLCEIIKHKSIEVVEICEIDKMCIEKSKIFFPQWSYIWEHPKVKVNIADGAIFLQNHVDEYDVIIVDSSDPIGPAKSLFERPFYELMYKALKNDGIICTQSESIWIHLEIIKNLYDLSSKIYKTVNYAYTTIPSYSSGQLGFIVCCKETNQLTKPKRTVEEAFIMTKKILYATIMKIFILRLLFYLILL